MGDLADLKRVRNRYTVDFWGRMARTLQRRINEAGPFRSNHAIRSSLFRFRPTGTLKGLFSTTAGEP